MKKTFLTLQLMTLCLISFSQELPTEPADGFKFPIGSKFTIELHPIDSIRFQYSIIEYEPYQEVVNTYENDSLFDSTGKNGTIEFYFCLSTDGETEKEREENMQVVLLMKNRTKYSLSYDSDIQLEENGEFQETSNVGSFSGAKGTEMWPYMIYQIGLTDFKKLY
ncbi:hypothetical protein [Sediminitomix flava]|uniref:Uncharacterized protein n=1 Tax=Sediminitomix flava TaxID=379075 RepID=A0A315YV24_SEDFL|nr:hypothetical protein [Sediminitomix flava]PWJ33124.1 hypothetical protein BC781_11510 [Sediminitomix flava]